VLDAFGGTGELADRWRAARAAYDAARAELEDFDRRAQERAERLDLLRFQAQELEAARITPELCARLRRHHPLFISVHANHPRELSLEARQALGRLADAGIPLGSQTVLLRHVNDHPAVMRALMHKLLACRVRPYYLYQCDLIAGSAHFRTSVRRGLEIMDSLRGHTTGYAVPRYVIDAPGGGGKVPIHPPYILSHNADRVVFRNHEGRVFEYPETPDDPAGDRRLSITPPLSPARSRWEES